jgi:hypothetical protein
MRWGVLLAAAAFAGPVQAQDADVAPAKIVAPVQAVATVAPADSDVAPFYAAHPGTLVWLRDANSRAAATKLAALLKAAPIDGLAEGHALAASVDAALAAGTPAGDQIV